MTKKLLNDYEYGTLSLKYFEIFFANKNLSTLLCFLFLCGVTSCGSDHFEINTQTELNDTILVSNVEKSTFITKQNYPYELPGYYYILATNTANDMVEVYAGYYQDWDNPNAIKWSFKPSTSNGFTQDQINLWDFPRHARFRNNSLFGGDCVASVGKNLACVVNFRTKQKQWAVDIGNDTTPRQIEILPSGNVALVASGIEGNWIRVYASSQGENNTNYAQKLLYDARAVLWDDQNQYLWAIGKISSSDTSYVLTAFTIGSSQTPILNEVTSLRTQIPGGQAKDISTVVGNPNKFWISGSDALYIFDINDKSFTAAPSPLNKGGYINVSSHPHGLIITMERDGGAYLTSNTIVQYSLKEEVSVKTNNTARFTSVQACNPNYQDRTEYNVVSWNLRSATLDEGHPQHDWEVRLPYVKKIISQYDFDIFGVQEAKINQIEDLESGVWDHYGVSVQGTTTGNMNNIFWRKWKFEQIDGGEFWLSPGAPDYSSGPSWDATQKRMCTWVKLKDLYSDFRFYVFNTHYQAPGAESRKQSAYLFISKIPEITRNTPYLVLGDFNVNQNQNTYDILVDSGLFIDAYDYSEYNYSTSTTINHWEINPTGDKRIDHIFLSPSQWGSKSHNVITEIFDDIIPSDHYPVMIEVKPE